MDQHLDAERLAAFADGSLSSAERVAVEAHAADCPHCLQLLAAMARTEDAATVPCGVAAAGLRAMGGSPGRRGNRRWRCGSTWIREPRPELTSASTEQAKVSARQAGADEARSRVRHPQQPAPVADLRKFEQLTPPPARDNEKVLTPPPRDETREAFSRADKELDATEPSARIQCPPEKRPSALQDQAAPASPAPAPGARHRGDTTAAGERFAFTRRRAAAKARQRPAGCCSRNNHFGTSEPTSVAAASGLRQRLAAVGAIEAVSPDRRYRWRVNGSRRRAIDGRRGNVGGSVGYARCPRSWRSHRQVRRRGLVRRPRRSRVRFLGEQPGRA